MERKTVTLEERQIEAADRMSETTDGNESEAIRIALNRGLRELGYLNGVPRIVTALKITAFILLFQSCGAILVTVLFNTREYIMVIEMLILTSAISIAIAKGIKWHMNKSGAE